MVEQEQSFNWAPLESNPEIFEKYMEQVGLNTEAWGFNEVYGFDEDLLAFLPQPIKAVIIAAERLKKVEDVEMGSEANNKIVPYYMKQTSVLDNACGIIACLHSVLNGLTVTDLKPDSVLAKFNEQAKEMDPAARATFLENSHEF
jgi:ubiquitin carboxyl-terminal hydrolase L3